MTDFVLPDIQEGLENLVKMQQHFTLDADEESEQQTEDVKEGNEIKEGTKVSADKNV
jgi:hypothetical protein